MAKCKSVWFCESDTGKWFEKSADAERFDKIAEVVAFVGAKVAAHPGQINEIVELIMEKYTLDRRYDWEEHEKEDGQGDETDPA